MKVDNNDEMVYPATKITRFVGDGTGVPGEACLIHLTIVAPQQLPTVGPFCHLRTQETTVHFDSMTPNGPANDHHAPNHGGQ